MELEHRINSIVRRHVPSDLRLDIINAPRECSGNEFYGIDIFYRGGTEHLPLSAIIDDLRKLGKVTVDYHGPNVDEGTRIIFEVAAPDGEYVVMKWHADDTGSGQDHRSALVPDIALGNETQLLAA